jgi:hypothetical protein
MSALANPGVVLDGLAARAHLAKTAEVRDAYECAATALRQEPTALLPRTSRRRPRSCQKF